MCIRDRYTAISNPTLNFFPMFPVLLLLLLFFLYTSSGSWSSWECTMATMLPLIPHAFRNTLWPSWRQFHIMVDIASFSASIFYFFVSTNDLYHPSNNYPYPYWSYQYWLVNDAEGKHTLPTPVVIVHMRLFETQLMDELDIFSRSFCDHVFWCFDRNLMNVTSPLFLLLFSKMANEDEYDGEWIPRSHFYWQQNKSPCSSWYAGMVGYNQGVHRRRKGK